MKINYLKEVVVKNDDRPQASRYSNFPFSAVEEAVVNAIYHRSYEIREPVEIRIDNTELVVLSFPGPDRSIDLNSLSQGRAVSRRYRNRRIGKFLKELELTEGRSTGIPKILRSMQNNESPQPIFETDIERSYFLIRLPINKLFLGKHSDIHEAQSEAEKAQSDLKNQQKVARHIVESAPLRELLISIAQFNLVSARELVIELGLSDKHGSFKRNLAYLMKEGLIQYQYPEKPTSRIQKYLITDYGQSIVVGMK